MWSAGAATLVPQEKKYATDGTAMQHVRYVDSRDNSLSEGPRSSYPSGKNNIREDDMTDGAPAPPPAEHSFALSISERPRTINLHQ